MTDEVFIFLEGVTDDDGTTTPGGTGLIGVVVVGTTSLLLLSISDWQVASVSVDSVSSQSFSSTSASGSVTAQVSTDISSLVAVTSLFSQSLSPLEIEREESAKKSQDIIDCMLGLVSSSSSSKSSLSESSSFSLSLSSYRFLTSSSWVWVKEAKDERYSFILSSYCLINCSFLDKSSRSCMRILCKDSIWLINAVTWLCNFWLKDRASFSASSSSKTCSAKFSFSSLRHWTCCFRLLFSSWTLFRESSTSQRRTKVCEDAVTAGDSKSLEDCLSNSVDVLSASSLSSDSSWLRFAAEVESEGEAWQSSKCEESVIDVCSLSWGRVCEKEASVWVEESTKSTTSRPSSEEAEDELEDGQEGLECIPESEWGSMRCRQHLLEFPASQDDGSDEVVAGEWDDDRLSSSPSDSWLESWTDDRVDVVLTSKSAKPSSSEAWWGRLRWFPLGRCSGDSVAEEMELTWDPIVSPSDSDSSLIRSFVWWLFSSSWSWWRWVVSSRRRASSSLRETTSIWSFMFSSMKSLSRDSKDSSCSRRETHSSRRHCIVLLL